MLASSPFLHSPVLQAQLHSFLVQNNVRYLYTMLADFLNVLSPSFWYCIYQVCGCEYFCLSPSTLLITQHFYVFNLRKSDTVLVYAASRGLNCTIFELRQMGPMYLMVLSLPKRSTFIDLICQTILYSMAEQGAS